jgi:TolA-binding protein
MSKAIIFAAESEGKIRKGHYLRGEAMNSKTLSWILRTALCVLALLAITGGISSIFNEKGTTTVLAQQDPFLDRRISQIEQRFNQIESRINRLEQQTSLPSLAPPTSLNRDTEINQMRSQINELQLRIAEVECGLLRIDERTLTAPAKQSRRKTNSNETDHCRTDSNVPLQLSTRP